MVAHLIIHVRLTHRVKTPKNEEKTHETQLLKHPQFLPVCAPDSSYKHVRSHAGRYPSLTVMACYSPVVAWKSLTPNVRGRYTMRFKYDRFCGDTVQLPCGKCTGCIIDRSHEWSIRIYQEASLYDRNSFVTLTYDDSHLPDDSRLDIRHLQLFWKRLRHLGPVRYYACGEYGSETRRPHYHAIVFGQDFRSHDTLPVGEGLYATPFLTDTWGMGHVTVADVTMATCCYVAGYVNKKLGVDDGFQLMSRRPGIGSRWLRENIENVARLRSVVIEGKEHPVPRRYMQWALDEFEHIKEEKVDRVKTRLQRLIEVYGDGAIAEMDRERDAKKTYAEQKIQHQKNKQRI